MAVCCVCGTIEKLPIPVDGGYHQKCYRYFVDTTKQERVKIAKLKREAQPETSANTEQPTEAKDTGEPVAKKKRFRSRLEKRQSRNVHVLPEACIICKSGYFKDKSGRKQKERLSLCELIDGGQLFKAAKLKKDKNLLLQIENKDCVAIEVRYHSSCHRSYTRLVSQPELISDRPVPVYHEAFQKFCETFVEKNLLQDQKIIRLTKLKKSFDQIVLEVENKDSTGFNEYQFMPIDEEFEEDEEEENEEGDTFDIEQSSD